ncbi:MAG TPA: hypothetical protein PLN81_02960 [Bacillota bacterium]|jgi:predicted DNA-binding ArsR family transcriptional regulator|nr:hypothetical protein [Bacillota bacterium]HPT60534.1 hypothetical protein [Bacillota bacterium]HQD78060.1 hypothetical protein [Bacillota bacterium]
MNLREELEKVKLELQASFERLAKEGQITLNDLDQVYDLMDEMESLSEEEFKTRLNDLKKKFGVVDI